MEQYLKPETVEHLMLILGEYGLRVIGAVLLLIGGRVVAGWVRGLVRRALRRAKIDIAVADFLATVAYVSVLIVAVVAALNKFGVETASIVGILAAAGFAVGMALQGSLANFAAGILLLIFRPFKVGDFIEAGGVMGTVNEIQIFNTIVSSPDNVRQILPNGQVYGSVIKNFTANPTRRIDLVVGIGYSSNVGRAKEILSELVEEDERLHKEPIPIIAVKELADSSVNILVRVWTTREEFFNAQWHLLEQLKLRFDSEGIEIPFPQRTLHIVRDEE